MLGNSPMGAWGLCAFVVETFPRQIDGSRPDRMTPWRLDRSRATRLNSCCPIVAGWGVVCAAGQIPPPTGKCLNPRNPIHRTPLSEFPQNWGFANLRVDQLILLFAQR